MDRRRLEERLMASERSLAEAIDTILGRVWGVRPNGVRPEVNSEAPVASCKIAVSPVFSDSACCLIQPLAIFREILNLH